MRGIASLVVVLWVGGCYQSRQVEQCVTGVEPSTELWEGTAQGAEADRVAAALCAPTFCGESLLTTTVDEHRVALECFHDHFRACRPAHLRGVFHAACGPLLFDHFVEQDGSGGCRVRQIESDELYCGGDPEARARTCDQLTIGRDTDRVFEVELSGCTDYSTR